LRKYLPETTKSVVTHTDDEFRELEMCSQYMKNKESPQQSKRKKHAEQSASFFISCDIDIEGPSQERQEQLERYLENHIFTHIL